MCTNKSDYGNIVIDITDGTQPAIADQEQRYSPNIEVLIKDTVYQRENIFLEAEDEVKIKVQIAGRAYAEAFNLNTELKHTCLLW